MNTKIGENRERFQVTVNEENQPVVRRVMKALGHNKAGAVNLLLKLGGPEFEKRLSNFREARTA